MKNNIIYLAVFVAILASGPSLGAQNNPYKIDDGLFEIYQRGMAQVFKSECLATADTMYREAVRIGDTKAQCLAKAIIVSHYMNKKDLEQTVKAADDLSATAKELGYPQYYFHGMSQKATLYSSKAMGTQASQVLEKMQKDAVEMDYPFGVATALIQTGHMYQQQLRYKTATKYYIQAAEFIERAVPDQSPSNAYMQAADCCFKDQQFKKCINYSEKSLEGFAGDKLSIRLHDLRASAAYMINDMSTFWDSVNKMKDIAKGNDELHNRGLYTPAILKALEGKYDEALNIIDDNARGAAKFLLQRKMYQQLGNWKLAVAVGDSLFDYVINHKEELTEEYMANTAATLETEKLKTENALLELDKQKISNRIYLVSILFLIVLIVYCIFSFSKLKKKNTELKFERDRAEHSEKMKTLFVQNMSHEIRTPLNSIVGFAQLLADDDPDEPMPREERDEYAEIISDNADQLATLIDDILNISDIESGKYKINKEMVSCNDICHSCIMNLKDRIPAGVDLIFKSDVPDDLKIFTDKHRVMQIITNLMTNACKYTEKGSITLEVSDTENPGNITFAVADTGSGISAEKAEIIFNRFEKLDSFKPGTGLGLPICRMIAGILSSEVKLDTSYTQGARFVLIHPAKNN